MRLPTCYAWLSLPFLILAGCGSPGPRQELTEPVQAEPGGLTQGQLEEKIEADMLAMRRQRAERQAAGKLTLADWRLPEPDAQWASVTRQASTEPSLARRLRSTQVASLVIEDEESLRAVVDQLRLVTGLPLVVTPQAEASVVDNGVLFTFNMTKGVSARSLLNLIAEMAGAEVAWVIRHDAVIFTTEERAQQEQVLQMHDIRRLTRERRDFSGPRINTIRLLGELEDEDGGGAFGGLEVTRAAYEPDEVVELLRTSVAIGSWGKGGNSMSVTSGGMLLVRHTPKVQREVARFLMRLGS
jgi:hypothetical protein